MKISVFTTTTNPTVRGDNWQDAIRCYADLADEVIIINGGEDLGVNAGFVLNNIKIIQSDWPKEFDWPLIGQQFQRGYEAATGDWVIHADLDFIFHEKDFDKIRRAFTDNPNQPALTFWKHQFILPDRYNLKSRLVIAVNKKVYGDRIRFDSGGDLCQPSLDGEQIKSDFVAEARVAIYNYEKMTKTSDQIMDDCGRMDRAYRRHFKAWQLSADGSGSDESCFDGYIQLMIGRLKKPSEHIKLSEHPKYVRDTIRNLNPEEFGYNGFGLLGGESDYKKEAIHA